MSATFACMAGEAVHRLVTSGQLKVRELGAPRTPFGAGQPIYLIEDAAAPYYLICRCCPDGRGLAAGQTNWRANLYALKDLGVQAVLSWSAAGAITHNLSIGQVVVPDDVLDLTRQRAMTFFEHCDLGLLRQFPVFCPHLRGVLDEALRQQKLDSHFGGTVAVTEGPRLETPAEIRMLAAVGAELACHSLAPEVFLARELQLCFAGACYLVNYAETGSRHRPFSGDLFGGLSPASQAYRVARVAEGLPALLSAVAAGLAAAPRNCDCERSLAPHIQSGRIGPDWHTWFGPASPA